MRSQNLLAIGGLLYGLSACAVTVTPDTGLPQTARSTEPVAAAEACEVLDVQPSPMAAPENAPIFEQFNFQPSEIDVSEKTVSIQTPYYTFSFCKGDRTWSIVSSKPPVEDFDYGQFLADVADPAYETIEVNGESYQYRIRLEANWLDEQVAETETAVYFELIAPDGEETIHQLYTLAEVQDSQLGASLGVPRIAGAVVADNALWFAATTSQGEGDNGFASLLSYSPDTGELRVDRPEEIQGDQITTIAATGSSNTDTLTLWLGTQLSGEGNPYLPASGLVAYQPATKTLNSYTITNSPIVGAIPYQLAVADDSLWVATGNGTCQVQWQSANQANSWDCWRLTTTATLPPSGVDIYPTFLATEAAATLTNPTVEVLWASQEQPEWDAEQTAAPEPGMIRYEVAYEPGFEALLPQGGYRVANAVAKRAVGGEPVFWPGWQWHWEGDRFVRGLDEVALNLVGGGPYGLYSEMSDRRLAFDHQAIRGDVDLLDLTAESTQVRYYSGWVDGSELAVYPTMVPATTPATEQPDPVAEIAARLPVQGP
ncbi:MAG: hypothetical protein WBB01_01855 [Phormidesmis sp.]